MTKKFTEEQYHEIIKAWESQSFSLKRVQAVLEIMSINDRMPSNINGGLALANPLTREWAHEQFVEEEKKYVWHLKDNNSYMLTNHGGATHVNISHSTEYELTETEIRKWGYNPEMFDKEELKD